MDVYQYIQQLTTIEGQKRTLGTLYYQVSKFALTNQIFVLYLCFRSIDGYQNIQRRSKDQTYPNHQ